MAQQAKPRTPSRRGILTGRGACHHSRKTPLAAAVWAGRRCDPSHKVGYGCDALSQGRWLSDDIGFTRRNTPLGHCECEYRDFSCPIERRAIRHFECLMTVFGAKSARIWIDAINPAPGCYRLSAAMSLFFRPLLANRWFAQMQKMEDYMSDLTHNINDKMPRRGFFGRFAGAMVLAGFATTPVRAQSTSSPGCGPLRRQRRIPACVRILLPRAARTAERGLVGRNGGRRPAPRSAPDRARQRYLAKIQDRGGVQDPRYGDQGAGGQESVPASKGWRASGRRYAGRPTTRKRHGGRRLPSRPACAEQNARRQRRRERGRSLQGMGGKCDSGHHHHSIGNMGGEPRPGSRLHLLRGGLTILNLAVA